MKLIHYFDNTGLFFFFNIQNPIPLFINSYFLLSNDDAFVKSQSFIFSAKFTREYALQELDEAEIRLRCCKIHVRIIM